jgi:AcrR family transcriptional regulator
VARQIPADRLEKLIAVAAAAFVEHGFRRTQMDDIASGLGVSKGTVYRSVDSKDALLAAVLNYADAPEQLPPEGPIETDGLARVSATLRTRLADAVNDLDLAAAAEPAKGLTDSGLGSEIERIALDQFEMMAEHRVRIMVLDRCAPEVPELSGDWYEAGRYAIVDLWVDYLNRRSKYIDAAVDRAVLGRTIVELTTLWAVKMPWDPAPRPYPTDVGRECAAMIRNLVTGVHR